MTHFLTALLLLISTSLMATSPEQRGLEIYQEFDRRDSGFGDFSGKMTMVLSDRKGRTVERHMRMKSKEVANDGDKNLTIFETPRDVKGTAMLTHTHKTGDDDQWLYLPRLKRVKRIVSRNKSGAFMGSEFSYEDLSSQEVEKYTYQFLREEPCTLDGKTLHCFVLERYPVDKNSGYTRQIVWIDSSHYRMLKVDYFDRRNEHMKTLIFSNYQQYLETFWRASEMTMTNQRSAKSTRLLWSDYQFRRGLTDRDFDKNSLKRAR